MTSTQRKILAVFIISVIARLAFHIYTGFTADDAFITFRYAENFATGKGFVYNEGEHVLGTSTPFFTLILATFALLQFPLITTTLAFSVVASGITAAMMFRWAERLRFGDYATLPAIVYAVWPRSLPAETSGMETALFTLLVTAALYYSYRKLDVYSVGLATLATLTRPEGCIALGIVMVMSLVRDRRSWWRCLLASGLLLIPWLLFSWVYFDSPIPNSVPAKLALYSHFGYVSAWENLKFVLALHHPAGWGIIGFCLIGIVWLWRYQRFGMIELTWLALMIVFFTLSKTLLFFWYAAPLYPILLLMTFAGVFFVIRHVFHERGGKYTRHIVYSLVIGGIGLSNVVSLRYYRSYQDILSSVHKNIGNHLRTQAAESDLVAAEDIGYIGFYSKLTILDRDGLVSPGVIPFNKRAKYSDVIYEFGPSWVIAAKGSPTSAFITDEAFLSRYVQDTVFSHNAAQYNVYRTR